MAPRTLLAQAVAHRLGDALARSCRDGRLKGQAADGKLLARLRESTDQWQVEQILVTLQQLPEISLLELTSPIVDELRDAYARIRAKDARWAARFADIELLINPNGVLLNGGSDGDNGQTGASSSWIITVPACPSRSLRSSEQADTSATSRCPGTILGSWATHDSIGSSLKRMRAGALCCRTPFDPPVARYAWANRWLR